MKLINTKLPGSKIIKTNIYKDRGYLKETFRNNLFGKTNFPHDVIFQNV